MPCTTPKGFFLCVTVLGATMHFSPLAFQGQQWTEWGVSPAQLVTYLKVKSRLLFLTGITSHHSHRAGEEPGGSIGGKTTEPQLEDDSECPSPKEWPLMHS